MSLQERLTVVRMVVLALVVTTGSTVAACSNAGDNPVEAASEIYDPGAAVAANDPRPQDVVAPPGPDGTPGDANGTGEATADAEDDTTQETEIDPLAIRGEIIDKYSLAYGECFNQVTGMQAEQRVTVTARVDCTEPHLGEVFHTFELDVAHPAVYPGDEEMRGFTRRQCYDIFEGFVGMSYELSQYEIDVFTPNRTNFEDATARYRGVHCWLHHVDDEPISGTARGTAQ